MRASRRELPQAEETFEDPQGRRATTQAVEMGEMQGAFRFYEKDVDIAGPFVGLAHGMCPLPHWGYILSGRVRVVYLDREEVYEAGDLFYWPPPHMLRFEEDTEMLEFTPLQGYRDLLTSLAARAAD